MNAKKYCEWAKHYDPDYIELKYLSENGVDFDKKKVLEVGCGTGRFTQRITPFVSELMGIDPDVNAIKICQRLQQDNIKIQLGTLETTLVPQNHYDYVVFSWSMYMIDEKEKNIRLAYASLRPGGKMIILQANSGEFEEEVSKLYSHYSSLDVYGNACEALSIILHKVFDNVHEGTIVTSFLFDSIDQVINNSLFFIEDEEGITPSTQSITQFENNLKKYCAADGKIKMTDIVSVFIATK